MTPDQALQILDNAASQARLTRNDHIAVQESLATVRAAIPQPQPGKDPSPAPVPEPPVFSPQG